MAVANVPGRMHGRPDSVLEVLLVDDSPHNREVGVVLLSAIGIQPVVACNGTEALNLIRERAFDIVLMDIDMPVMDGLEATVEIRRFEEAKCADARIPIIAYTSTELSPAILRRVGLSAALRKPSNVSLMRECLRQCAAWIDLPPFAVPIIRRESRVKGNAASGAWIATVGTKSRRLTFELSGPGEAGRLARETENSASRLPGQGALPRRVRSRAKG